MGGATKISNAFSKDVFSNINNICVVINGVEYSSIAKSYATNQTYLGEFTGQYNCWTLDLSNPNSKVLEFMKVLGIIKPL